MGKKYVGIVLAIIMVLSLTLVTGTAAEKRPIPKVGKDTIAYSVVGQVAVESLDYQDYSEDKVYSIAGTVNSTEFKETTKVPKNKAVGKVIVKTVKNTYTITLYEDSILKIGKKYYTVDSESYNRWVHFSQALNFGGTPVWFTNIDTDNVKSISYLYNKDNKTVKINKKEIKEWADLIAGIQVASSNSKAYKGTKRVTSEGKQLKFTLDFISGTQLTVMLTDAEENASTDRKIYIEYSGMSYGCRYEIYEDDPRFEDTRRLIEKINKSITMDFDSWEQMELPPLMGKPVIYLYPEKETRVSVKLRLYGELTYTYPKYNDGWLVDAKPDGTLTNIADNTTHYYLFWEGNSHETAWHFPDGFVLKTSELEGFFEKSLPKMGLTPKEYNDFITYWVPKMMQTSEYHLIRFRGKEYENSADLTIEPEPDTLLRIHMLYKPLDAPIEIKEQILPVAKEREGFTVVEWGGTFSK